MREEEVSRSDVRISHATAASPQWPKRLLRIHNPPEFTEKEPKVGAKVHLRRRMDLGTRGEIHDSTTLGQRGKDDLRAVQDVLISPTRGCLFTWGSAYAVAEVVALKGPTRWTSTPEHTEA